MCLKIIYCFCVLFSTRHCRCSQIIFKPICMEHVMRWQRWDTYVAYVYICIFWINHFQVFPKRRHMVKECGGYWSCILWSGAMTEKCIFPKKERRREYRCGCGVGVLKRMWLNSIIRTLMLCFLYIYLGHILLRKISLARYRIQGIYK